jgi:hypothetical protein
MSASIPGDAAGGIDGSGARLSTAPKLSDLGISKTQSSRLTPHPHPLAGTSAGIRNAGREGMERC